MSNKKRIQKKIQCIENKRWFIEVTFIINKGFPDISAKSKEVAKAFSDFAAAAKPIFIDVAERSGIPIIKVLADDEFQKAYFEGQKAGEKCLEFFKRNDFKMDNIDALLQYPDGV